MRGENLDNNISHTPDRKKKNSGIPDRMIYAEVTGRDGAVLAQLHAFQAGVFRFNWQKALDITLVLRGSLTLHSEEAVLEMKENDIAIINRNVGHAAIQKEPGTVAVVLQIFEPYLMDVYGFLPYFSTERQSDESDSIIRRCMMLLTELPERTIQDGAQAAMLFGEAQLLALLSELSRTCAVTSEESIADLSETLQRKKQQRILKEVDKRFRTDLKLTELAELLGMNASYLSSYFSKRIGLSFHEYLTRKRLEYAIHLLNHSDGSITEIAYDAGFPNVKSFHAACRKYLNLTPGEYRKELERKGKAQIGDSLALPLNDPIVREKKKEYQKGI